MDLFIPMVTHKPGDSSCYEPGDRFNIKQIKESAYYLNPDIATKEEIECEFSARLKAMD
jgi:hypothetical protein